MLRRQRRAARVRVSNLHDRRQPTTSSWASLARRASGASEAELPRASTRRSRSPVDQERSSSRPVRPRLRPTSQPPPRSAARPPSVRRLSCSAGANGPDSAVVLLPVRPLPRRPVDVGVARASGAQPTYTVGQPRTPERPPALHRHRHQRRRPSEHRRERDDARDSRTACAAAAVPPQNNNSVPFSQDTHAPVARITKTTCTATRCTLSVSVTDAGFSAGIKTIQSSVRSTYKAKMQAQGSRQDRHLHEDDDQPSVAARTSTRFKIVASKLPYGTQRLTLAIDKAGQRQALPTTKTVTTKKPTKRR